MNVTEFVLLLRIREVLFSR